MNYSMRFFLLVIRAVGPLDFIFSNILFSYFVRIWSQDKSIYSESVNVSCMWIPFLCDGWNLK